MYNLSYYISLYMFLISCFFFSFYFNHLMLMIISLEFVTICLIYNMFIILMNMKIMIYMIIYMLVFSVCEGALVLSLVILLIRMYGNDYINSLSLMKW